MTLEKIAEIGSFNIKSLMRNLRKKALAFFSVSS